jgi:hypothetical protein
MQGKKMYNLPEGSKLFKDKSNNEMLVVNSLEDLKSFISGSKNKFDLIDVNDFMNINKNIVSDDNLDSLLDVYKLLVDNTNDAASRTYLKNKQKYYLEMKNAAKTAGLSQDSKTKDISSYL